MVIDPSYAEKPNNVGQNAIEILIMSQNTIIQMRTERFANTFEYIAFHSLEFDPVGMFSRR